MFIAAQARFLALLDAFPGTDPRGAQHRNKALKALQSAAASLQRTLSQIDLVDSLEGAQLVALCAGMPQWKSAADVRPQWPARERLAGLGSDLLWLLQALELSEWEAERTPDVQMWLLCAADAWAAGMGAEPSSSGGSGFLRALQEFQDSSGQCDRRVPRVNRDHWREAIKARKLRQQNLARDAQRPHAEHEGGE